MSTPAPEAPAAEVTPAQAKAEADAARAAGDDLAAIKAEARKWEAQAKANAKAADELATLKAAQLTESEKQAQALADAQARIADYERRDQVNDWKKSISEKRPDLRDLLSGDTEEAIRAHFDALAARIPDPKPADIPTPKGAIGPYVPGEGKQPNKSMGSTAEKFAEFIESKLN